MSTTPAAAAAASSSSSGPNVTTYHPTSYLSTLTAAFTQSLLDAAQHFRQQQPNGALTDVGPEYFVEATKIALRSVLTREFGVASAQLAAFTPAVNNDLATPGISAPPTPALEQQAANESTPAAPRKLIRTYIDGCFDIMHSGHYNAIRQAKALTDILVVGVHSDAEILRHKGPPVMNEQERLATVKGCKWVDEVVFDTPYDPSLELLIKLNCDFCVHGDDVSTTADGKDAYADVKDAGRMKIVKRTEGVSTTDLVGRLLLMTKNHHLNSPTLTPINGSPTLSSQIKDNTTTPPTFALEPTAATAAATTSASSSTPVRKSSDIVAPRRADDHSHQHYSSGISNFLPTTWRISQFSNHKTPSATDKIVYIDGAFDLFHVGHIETLHKAKDLGTFLYVGIHDDATVNRHKGKNYPIMNLHERVMNVLSCKYVDEVVIGAPWVITRDLITTLNLHIVASGSNTKMDVDVEASAAAVSGGALSDAYEVPKSLGIFREIETTHSLTTEDVVQRLIENRLKYENRNAKRSVKELNYIKGQKQYIAEI